MTNQANIASILQWRLFPKWLVGRSIAFFFVAMLACWVAFGYVPRLDLVLAASMSVVLFFGAGQAMAIKWVRNSEKLFLRNVFIAGLVVRVLWVLYMYFIFNPEHYGNTYGDTADVDWFMAFARGLAEWLTWNSQYSLVQLINEVYMSAIDDVGYPMLLAVEYVLTGGLSYVLIPMIVKCAVGAYCAMCIYRVAKRHFGEGTARIAAIFVCLNPNMIYWCASMMKEAEMVFVCCMAVDKVDEVLMSGNKLTFRGLLPGLLLGLYMFFLRTALGLAFFIAVIAHLVFASKKVASTGKKIVAGILVVITLFIGLGDRLLSETRGYVETISSDSQQVNMEWRSKREGGNSFAKYAGAAVFAPLIFTIPFPTFNTAEATQLLQIQLAGGSYIKNVLSYFVIVLMITLLLSRKWRDHVLILAYTCAYLGVLVFSSFAQSGRFHMPILPLLMLFAAYGIQQVRQNKQLRKMYIYVLMAEVLVCIAWNWFKLAGRGLI